MLGLVRPNLQWARRAPNRSAGSIIPWGPVPIAHASLDTNVQSVLELMPVRQENIAHLGSRGQEVGMADLPSLVEEVTLLE